ncbi:MAG TPA: hypothetical protein DCY88_19915 [Cyanobacteria bacterium UBA11372]|nr:hypothetical protein [Cyanobacteria bacterium UBA11372]
MQSLNLSQVQFTNQSDVVNPGTEIFNPKFFYVDTFKGNDQIIGTGNLTGDFALSAFVASAANGGTAIANANLSGKATLAVDAMKNEGTIYTNDGNDIVKGSATAKIAATAATMSQVIAIANSANASAIASAFANLNIKATAEGIDNSGGWINSGKGSDTIEGNLIGSVAAVAMATADASAIVDAICKAPMSEGLTAFAYAIATSLAQATISATAIKNAGGIITCDKGKDTISASATSSAGAFAGVYGSSFASATPENQALAMAVANASAKAYDQAIAIDNKWGVIVTGTGDDTIEATAKASNKAIAIDNVTGSITTGDGKDTIIAQATGANSYGIVGGFVDMGKGDDRLLASNFAGGVTIQMGEGKDFVQGFGNATVDGGKESDILSLGSYNRNSFKITFGANNGANFQLDGITMTTTGFEQFQFAGGVTYTYNQLIAA